MKKLKYFGYHERKVEVRAMTMGELKLAILRAFKEKGSRDTQLIDLTSGDTVTFKTMADVLENEWCDDCKIELINLPTVYGVLEDGHIRREGSKGIIVFQVAEEETDKFIKEDKPDQTAPVKEYEVPLTV